MSGCFDDQVSANSLGNPVIAEWVYTGRPSYQIYEMRFFNNVKFIDKQISVL